jgi:hypothetical protein
MKKQILFIAGIALVLVAVAVLIHHVDVPGVAGIVRRLHGG